MVLSFHMDHWQLNKLSAIERTSTTDVLVFHEPPQMPEPPTQEELDQYAANIKAEKVQRRLPRKPDGVHPPVSK